MDAQQQHDQRMKVPSLKQDSKKQLEALLKAKNGPSGEPKQSAPLDPIARAMLDHPTLTRAEAEEMATKFGF